MLELTLTSVCHYHLLESRGQSWVFIRQCPTCLLRQDLSLDLDLPSGLGYLAGEWQGPTYLCLSSA